MKYLILLILLSFTIFISCEPKMTQEATACAELAEFMGGGSGTNSKGQFWEDGHYVSTFEVLMRGGQSYENLLNQLSRELDRFGSSVVEGSQDAKEEGRRSVIVTWEVVLDDSDIVCRVKSTATENNSWTQLAISNK